MLKTLISCVAVATCLIAAPTTQAQQTQAGRLEQFDRQLKQLQQSTRLAINPDIPPEQRVFIDYGGLASFNVFAIDEIGNETHILRQTIVSKYLNVSLDGAHNFFVRGRAEYRDYNTGDSFDGHGDDLIGPTLDRAFYRFDYRRAHEAYQGETTPGNVTAQVGRQLFHWGNGLALSREIDGGTAAVEFSDFTLTGIAGRSRKSVNDIDSSRPGFENTQRSFYGGMLGWVSPNQRHRPYVYGYWQTDDANPGVNPRFGYNSYYIGAGSQGSITDRLIYGVEAVVERGKAWSDFGRLTGGGALIPQTDQDINAYALDMRLDFLVGDANQTRLSAELLFASGDGDRAALTSTTQFGNTPGTDDNAYNGFGFINTGLAFAPVVSNLAMLRVGASTKPLRSQKRFEQLQVGIDAFYFSKLDKDGPVDEFTTSGEGTLGIETDLYANWQVTSDLSLTARWGVFFPGDAIIAEHDPRHFLFTGVTIAY